MLCLAADVLIEEGEDAGVALRCTPALWLDAHTAIILFRYAFVSNRACLVRLHHV